MAVTGLHQQLCEDCGGEWLGVILLLLGVSWDKDSDTVQSSVSVNSIHSDKIKPTVTAKSSHSDTLQPSV